MSEHDLTVTDDYIYLDHHTPLPADVSEFAPAEDDNPQAHIGAQVVAE